MDQPRWLELAWADLGVAEAPGADNNSKVLRYFADAGHPEVRADEVAWCAAFVGACLERAGVASTRSLMARSYLAWGEPLPEPRAGAIAVLSRGSDPSLGHVGFLVGLTPSQAVLLGGNQGDAVSVAAFPRTHLLGLRWPAVSVMPDGASAPIRRWAVDATFERALAHVLEMEGGYDDDPYDPGGPTKRGITLSEFARDQGLELTAENFASLKEQLQAIPPATVRRIYRDRYWQAACCPELPPPLALFHFDAAVNQGVVGAARMLQEAVGAEIDGEIRRRRYRALPTFWRFGKGWLNRVGSTLALAQEIARAMPPLVPSHRSQPKGSRPMSTDTDLAAQPQPPQGKWWGHSMTIWGVMITALSTVLPVLGPAIGLDLTPELVRQLGDNVLNVGQAVGGLVGTVLAIYGRVRTSTPIERRQFTISM